MHTITWDPDKNQQLQPERDVSFDDVLLALMTDQVLADIPHPRLERYPGQCLLVVRIDNEAYSVKATSMRDPWHPETEEEEAAMMKRLDPEEREILEALNDLYYVFPPSDSQRVVALQKAAQAALAKTARVSIRLTAMDLAALKHKAQAEGIPYQTLIGSILHKYVTGQLMPRS